MQNGLRIPGRLSGIPALLAIFFVVLIPLTAGAQQAQIGIYNDLARSSCSLSDAGPGLIHAYVMVNSTAGVTGVRFAAPKPDCFNAVWVLDEIPNGYVSIGDSQTDISIATGSCQTGLRHVLTMVFQKSSATAPCCLFQLEAPPGLADMQFTDCSFTEYALAATDGYVNADATCPCSNGLDQPPSAPFNSYPRTDTINLPVSLTLTWEATDADLDPLHYDVYFGTAVDPPLVAQALTAPAYDVGPLSYATAYYWKVVVFDNAGHSTEGPVWNFTTGAVGVPPTPVQPSPEDGAINQPRTLALTWFLMGGTGAVLNYEIHFGTTTTPPVVATISASLNPSYQVEGLALNTTYYWYVVSLGDGKNTTGALWSFDTAVTNPPPGAPSFPAPVNGAISVPFTQELGWTASDPESQPLEYDVYFGTDPAPPFLVHVTSASHQVTDLVENTKYYWRVVAIDPDGGSASGAVWSFTTRGTGPPTVPEPVAPALSSTISPHAVHLQWSASDPEGGPLHYDVYLGTSTSPPQIASNVGAAELLLQNDLQQSTAYHWKVVAFDQDGLSTESPRWDFNTRALMAPNAPTTPFPASGAINVSRTPTLTWECTDPDNQPLSYTVTFGGTIYPAASNNFTPPFTLGHGITYHWSVRAFDTDGLSTLGPQWSFTTLPDNHSPTAPENVFPPNFSTGQETTVNLQWTSTDPEGLPMHFDVYFGEHNPPPRVAFNISQSNYTVANLGLDVDYYWQIVARDIDGNFSTGKVWQFSTGGPATHRLAIGLYSDAAGTSCSLADQGAGMRDVYVVLNGPTQYTGVRFAATKPACFNATWMYDSTPYVTVGNSQVDVSIGFGLCLDAPLAVMKITYMSAGNTQGCCEYKLDSPVIIGKMLVTDCSFQEIVPRSEPVLGISSNDACPVCDTGGYLAFAEAEDTCRATSSHLVTVDLRLHAAGDTDAGGVDVIMSPSLTYVSCVRGDMTQDWPTFTCQLQQGVLTIDAAGPTIPSGSTGVFARLTFSTNCCEWPVPAELGLADPTGDFLLDRLVGTHLGCRYPPDGDVNNDGNITVADAQCALETYLYAPNDPPAGCGGPGAAQRADVDCSATTTPGDANCIFHHWLDQSCSFCSGGAVSIRATQAAPHLALRVVRENDDVVVVLSANAAGDIEAFGLELTYPDGIEFLGVDPPAKDVFAALQARVVEPGRVRLGAYTNSGTSPLRGDGDLLAIRFHVTRGDPRGNVTALEFVDDLAGAQHVTASLDGMAAAPALNQVVLHQNSPNPFNPRTIIRFELPEPMHVRLSIFDVHGRLVKQLLDERREAGVSMVVWDGTDSHAGNVATGVYFYVLDAGGSRYQHKMVLLK